MSSALTDWINVIFRFMHVIAGIMWIGNSLLFTWMELNLRKPETAQDPDLLGELDMLHGGGVFHLQKRIMHADSIPERLHWFKWQSYTTWITGFILLGALFHSNGTTLLDITRSTLSSRTAVGLSLLGLFGGWFLYDLLWRSPLRKKPRLGLAVSLVFLFSAAAAYGSQFNGRALYLQIGAMMGTCMSANVFFHIIPNQHKFMRALRAGKPHNLELGKAAKMRSMHNHYMTFPVVFLMLSAHFPRLHAADRNVPILLTVILALMLMKHLMNTRGHFKGWLLSIVTVVALAGMLISWFLKPTASAQISASPAIHSGKQLFVTLGCGACHQQGTGGQIAPSLEGVYGSFQRLTDGRKILADEAYLRRSILEPQSQVVQGYPPSMPSFSGQISEPQLADLIAYLQSIGIPPSE